MDRLRDISRYVDGISVVIALILQEIAVDAVLPDGASPTIYRLFSIPLVLIAIHVLRSIAMQLITRSSPILRRVLRGDYIEGAWLGRSATDNALINIEFRGQDICASGSVFDYDGEIVMRWRTLWARYDGDLLRYWVVLMCGETAAPEEAHGYCEIQFERSAPHAVPHAYGGKFLDVTGRFAELKIDAERITDKALLRKLKTREGTRQVFRELGRTHLQPPNESSGETESSRSQR